MSGFLMAAGRLGSIAALVALLIVLVKQLIALVGFLMVALKIAIILAFAGLMLLIVITYLSARNRRRREAEEV